MNKTSQTKSKHKRVSTYLPLFVSALICFSSTATADEGGVAFWFSGQYASFAAVPATPGWSVPIMGYYYDGGAKGGKDLQRGNQLTAELDSTVPIIMIQPSYAPKTKVWGGQLNMGIGFGWGENSSDASVSAILDGMSEKRSASDSTTGFTDLYPIVSLAWANGTNNWMSYITGDIPVGDYDANNLANLGIGHAAIDVGGGYTYFDPTKGHELSAVLGVTYNFENDDTDYQNGVDIHLDWAVSQFLNPNWQVGLVGYVYGQLSSDSSPHAFNDNRSSNVASVGPEIGYSFSMGEQAAYINLRAYWEFEAKNRVEGTAVFTTISLPL
ncbi:transporter [Kiritimatiellota bacterium B12222]|nr:transporter [Kiritimatiellota bacterium B12222]